MTAKGSKKSRKPLAKYKPKGRSVRKEFNPQEFENRYPSWKIGQIDRTYLCGWEDISRDELWNQIYPKIRDFETMKWASITRDGSHNVPRYELIRDARNRLDELRLDDEEELFSLRLSGERRIWGILRGSILTILWYDPDHQICPAPKKHT